MLSNEQEHIRKELAKRMRVIPWGKFEANLLPSLFVLMVMNLIVSFAILLLK